jgi:hypothetical protein
MNLAARSPPGVAVLRPSIESCASAERIRRTSFEFATYGAALPTDADGAVPDEAGDWYAQAAATMADTGMASFEGFMICRVGDWSFDANLPIERVVRNAPDHKIGGDGDPFPEVSMSRFVGTVLVVLSLTGCNGTTDPDGGILSYDGSVSVKSETPIVVSGTVTIRNTSESVVTIERNACPGLNLHWYASSNSAPAWTEEDGVCLGISLPLDLAPGNSYTYTLHAATIPSNLRDGLYYATAVSSNWRGGRPVTLGNIQIVNGKASQ